MDLSPASIAVWIVIALFAWAVVAMAPHRPRRSGKPGGFQIMAAMMLGLGEPLDPPSKHVAESKSDNPKEGDSTGDPPTT